MTDEARFYFDHGYAHAKRDFYKALEDIKADIIRHSKICDPEFKDAFEVTVQIIDKHVGEQI